MLDRLTAPITAMFLKTFIIRTVEKFENHSSISATKLNRNFTFKKNFSKSEFTSEILKFYCYKAFQNSNISTKLIKANCDILYHEFNRPLELGLFMKL